MDAYCVIAKENNNFITSVYRKRTFTDLGMKFSSFIPNIFKINLILTLLNRAYNICSNYQLLDKEIQYLKTYLLKNGFGINFIEKVIKKFLNKKFISKSSIPTVPKFTFNISLPYNGKQSIILKKKFNYLLTKFYPQLNFRFLFKNNNNIGSFFKYKEQIPKFLCSNIIYKYTCSECNSDYIGKTSRQFKVRVFEHKGFSIRTKMIQSSPMNSRIRDHSLKFDHRIKDDNFKILNRGRESELLILESLYILQMKPKLNDANCANNLEIVS